jgi:hypothetical protein
MDRGIEIYIMQRRKDRQMNKRGCVYWWYLEGRNSRPWDLKLWNLEPSARC